MATRVGAVFSTLFLPEHPEAVLTMETKGIPIALMTAKHLSVPLLIARRDSRAYEAVSYTHLDVYKRQMLVPSRCSQCDGTRNFRRITLFRYST